MVRVGVLALQGDFLEHLEVLQNLAETRLIMGAKDFNADGGIDALVLPGGESTTIGRLLEATALKSELIEKIKEGMPTLATCAGTVLLAKRIKDRVVGETDQQRLGVMDISVIRNGFGRQSNSFECKVELKGIGAVKASFIRAPRIDSVWGSAEPIGYINHPKVGRTIVGAVQSNIIALTFHPEIHGDEKVHRTLISMVRR
ncbi:MAG: pyridoxal 5'-phosphate synthase glutaminase subunit PdxT [Candidatus Methanomethyliales bacterium]|nr:pyridoxal 5'-phosphate synthase glutaminase subunit PdxT [Candidatus Methanomethylicales archaeon]